MNTDIEFLKQLDIDLKDAARREMAKRERAATPARRRTGQMWVRVAGVAAAFLVVAGAIGFVAGGGGGADSGGAGEFQQVGDAVASDGGGEGTARRAVGEGTAGNELGFQPGTAPQALPSATPAPGTSYSISGNQHGRQQQDLSKIIRDGRISVTIDDATFGQNEDRLTSIAELNGGFVLSSSTVRERSGTFVLRIPAKHFDRALGQIRALGDVRSQQVTGDDVTAEFIDYQARLRILQARRTVLFELFKQANTISETLQLQSQLDDVQLKIEQIQGQINFINDQVAEATLRVTIQERSAPKARTQTDIDNPDLGSSFDLAVQGFLRIVGAVIVGLGYLIPLTVLGAIVWLGVWFVRRRRLA